MVETKIAGLPYIPKGKTVRQTGTLVYVTDKKQRRGSKMSKKAKDAIKRSLRRPSIIAGGSVALNALDAVDDGLKASGTPFRKGAVALDSLGSRYYGISRYKPNTAKAVFERLALGWAPLSALAVASKFGLTRRLGQAMKGLPFRQ